MDSPGFLGSDRLQVSTHADATLGLYSGTGKDTLFTIIICWVELFTQRALDPLGSGYRSRALAGQVGRLSPAFFRLDFSQ